MADHDSLAARVGKLERELRDLAQAVAIDIAVRKERYQQSVEQRGDTRDAVRSLREQLDKLRDEVKGGAATPLPKELLPYAQTGALGWLLLKYLGIIP